MRGQPGRGLARWDEQGVCPLTHTLRPHCCQHPSLPGRWSRLLGWGGGAGRRWLPVGLSLHPMPTTPGGACDEPHPELGL